MGGKGARRKGEGLMGGRWRWQESSEAQRSAVGLEGELWG